MNSFASENCTSLVDKAEENEIVSSRNLCTEVLTPSSWDCACTTGQGPTGREDKMERSQHPDLVPLSYGQTQVQGPSESRTREETDTQAKDRHFGKNLTLAPEVQPPQG